MPLFSVTFCLKKRKKRKNYLKKKKKRNELQLQ